MRFASLISFTFVATAVTLAACSSGPANLPPGGGVGKVDSAGSSGSNANAVPQTSPTARPTPEFVYQLSYPRANTAGLAPLIDAFDLGTQTRFASYPTLLTSSNNFVAFARGFLSHDGTTVIIAAELTQGSSSFTTSTNVYRQAVAVAKPASQLRRPQEVVVQPSMAEIGPEGTAFQDAAIASDDTVYVLASVPGSIPAQQISTVRADGSLSTVPNPLPTFNTPQSIAVGPDNTLYIATGFGPVFQLNPTATQVVGQFPTPPPSPAPSTPPAASPTAVPTPSSFFGLPGSLLVGSTAAYQTGFFAAATGGSALMTTALPSGAVSYTKLDGTPFSKPVLSHDGRSLFVTVAAGNGTTLELERVDLASGFTATSLLPTDDGIVMPSLAITGDDATVLIGSTLRLPTATTPFVPGFLLEFNAVDLSFERAIQDLKALPQAVLVAQ